MIEMDAASNNSVEDIRSIKEKINFLPTLAKYRVYIIDEVHMLSTGAFNALLKTLEEPPEHVKFILATTEPQKLLATILSRCQRFDFKKISNEDLIKRMKVICDESGIQITESALNLIANLSEGAARDALSILERCLQDGDTNIDENKIKDLVGIPKFVYVNNIVTGIIEKDIEKSLNAMNEVLDQGKDLGNFLWEMIKHTKDILMYKVSKKNDIYSEEEIKKIAEISERVSKEELINIIYKLSELESKMKLSSQKTIIFETEIIKLCVKQDTLGIEDRIEKLEEAVKSGKVATSSISISQVAPEPKVQYQELATRTYMPSTEEKKEEKMPKVEKMQDTKLKENEKILDGTTITNWQGVLNDLKKKGKVMLYANLVGTEAVEVNDMTVAIRFYNGLNDFRERLLKQSENINLLTKEISMMCGKTMQIKFEDASGVKTAPARKLSIPEIKEEKKILVDSRQENEETIDDDLLNSLDIPINIVDE